MSAILPDMWRHHARIPGLGAHLVDEFARRPMRACAWIAFVGNDDGADEGFNAVAHGARGFGNGLCHISLPSGLDFGLS